MLTNPNTLGLFDANIEEIAAIVHDVGATLYYDGANLNAVMGISRPGDMGFDIVHFNLHKSFTQPHGGGGPGVGPDRRLRAHRALPAAPGDRAPRRRRRQRLGRRVRPRLRAPAVDRAPARLPGQLRLLRARLRLHLLARRRRPARRLRDGRAERQLPARAAARARRLRAAAARLRAALHARVRAQRRADEAAARHPHARPRQAPARPRLPPADRVLPAARRGGAADRADRDRDARDARRVRRGARGDPARGARGPRDRARRALHDAGAAARRGRRAAKRPVLPPGAARRRRARARGAIDTLPAPMRIFSGIQPTGRKHLGNYIGAITQYVAGQDRGEAIYCIVDLHAITVAFDPGELRERTYDTAAILLAAGLDRAALHPVSPERRARAHRARLAAVLGHGLRRPQAHAPVQGEVAPRSASWSRPGCSSTRC